MVCCASRAHQPLDYILHISPLARFFVVGAIAPLIYFFVTATLIDWVRVEQVLRALPGHCWLLTHLLQRRTHKRYGASSSLCPVCPASRMFSSTVLESAQK